MTDGKNLRLLGREPSPASQPTVAEMIRTLEVELAKGEAVYTADELALLERKLAEYRELYRAMQFGG